MNQYHYFRIFSGPYYSYLFWVKIFSKGHRFLALRLKPFSFRLSPLQVKQGKGESVYTIDTPILNTESLIISASHLILKSINQRSWSFTVLSESTYLMNLGLKYQDKLFFSKMRNIKFNVISVGRQPFIFCPSQMPIALIIKSIMDT